MNPSVLEGHLTEILWSPGRAGTTLAWLETTEGEAVRVAGTANHPRPGDRVRLRGAFSRHVGRGQVFAYHESQLLPPDDPWRLPAFLAGATGLPEADFQPVADAFGNQMLTVLLHYPEQVATLDLPGAVHEALEQFREAMSTPAAGERLQAAARALSLTDAETAHVERMLAPDPEAVLAERPYRLHRALPRLTPNQLDAAAEALEIPDPIGRWEAVLRDTVRRLPNRGITRLEPAELTRRAREHPQAAPAEQVDTEGALKAGLEALLDEGILIELADGRVSLAAVEPLIEDLLTQLAALHHAEPLVEALPPLERLPRILDDELLGQLPDLAPMEDTLNAPVGLITTPPGPTRSAVVTALHQVWSALGGSPRIFTAGPTAEVPAGLPATYLGQALGPADLHAPPPPPAILEADTALVLDAERLDLAHFERLTAALQPGTRLILFGDPAAGAPLAAGAPFFDLWQCAAIPSHPLPAPTGRPGRKMDELIHGLRPLEGIVDQLGKSLSLYACADETILSALPTILTRLLPKVGVTDPLHDARILHAGFREPPTVGQLNAVVREQIQPATVTDPSQPGKGEPICLVRALPAPSAYPAGTRLLFADEGAETAFLPPDGVPVPLPQPLREVATAGYVESLWRDARAPTRAMVLILPSTTPTSMIHQGLIHAAAHAAAERVILLGDRAVIEQALTIPASQPDTELAGRLDEHLIQIQDLDTD